MPSSKTFRMEVRVGSAWVPAAREPVPAAEVDKWTRKFKTARPHAKVRAVPVEKV